MSSGPSEPTLRRIIIGPEAGRPLLEVPEVMALAGRGLEGDRYFLGVGTFDRPQAQPDGRQVSLIAREAWVECLSRLGLSEHELPVSALRRNLVVEGIDLSSWVRTDFRIGEVALRGLRPAPPCRYLARLVGVDLMAGLKGIGGLRADILSTGRLRVGDPIVVGQARRLG